MTNKEAVAELLEEYLQDASAQYSFQQILQPMEKNKLVIQCQM
ncbi:hypothetical protein [Paenibacillus alginolyticus]|nr:hypothetical protein [Paenibacillus frigoriresistens]